MQRVYVELALLLFSFTTTSIHLINQFSFLSTFSCLLSSAVKGSRVIWKETKDNCENNSKGHFAS